MWSLLLSLANSLSLEEGKEVPSEGPGDVPLKSAFCIPVTLWSVTVVG
jgi:hypothetical protein